MTAHKPVSSSFFILMLLILSTLSGIAQSYGLVLHGGAGHVTPESLGEEKVKAYELALKEALTIGYNVLDSDGSAEEAVMATINFLEDSPLFNAGKGAVLNAQGSVEMDASIMRGSDLNAGAVAGVRTVKHPINAAYAVMEESKHVLLAGEGADGFAESQGLEIVDPSYFITPENKKRLERIQKSEKTQGSLNKVKLDPLDSKHGTVGVVALDKDRNLAAGTSTGGMTNKYFNRIGDSPIIGAGTYADNQSCAVSCTGHGEYFIRLSVAHEVSALMKHRQWDIDKAANFVVHKELQELGGNGGLIAIDRRGNISMPFNTTSMFRAYRLSTGAEQIAIFKD